MASPSPPPASATASTPTPESWDAPTLLSLLPRLTFTQGLVVGQLSIILVVVALVRYLLFEDHAAGGQDNEASGQRSEEAGRSFPQESTRRPAATRNASSLLSLSLSSLAPSRAKSPPLPPLNSSDEKAGSGPTLATLARIPDAVGYDMETASDCDVGWLNVLLAHVWEGYRDDFLAGGSRASPSSDSDAAAPRSARTFMQDVLNRRRDPSTSSPSFLDPIQVSAVHPGSSYPLLSNARVRPRDDAGRVRIEVDVDYTDVVSLDVTTALCLNFPRPRFAVLPVSLGVRITRFSGTLSLCVVSHPPSTTSPDKRSRHSLEVSLHPDFLLLATCSSLVGSRAKLQDIPKIQQVMLQRIRGAILDKVGWPKAWTVEMPDLVTGRGRSEAAREDGGEGEGEEEWEEEYEGEREEEEEEDGWQGYEDEMDDEMDARYWQQQQQQRYARRPTAQQLNGHASRGDVDVNITPRPRRRAPAGVAATTTGAAPRSGGGAGGAGPARRRRPAAAATPPLPSASAPSIARPPPSADQLTSISRRPAAQRHHTTSTTKSASRNGAQPPRTPPPPLNGVEAWRKEMVRKTRGGTPGAERRLN